MNKKTILTLLVLVTVGLAYWLINKKPWGVNFKDIANFSIEDTAAIDKIFIADRNGKSVILEKKAPQTWVINGNKLADYSKVELLLNTMKNVKVLRPVLENEHNTAVGDLATVGIKAQFYANNSVVKTVYVGSATQEQNGTYMLIENASKPYATHIPGFFGFLTPRFITDSLIWRDRTIFNYTPDQIKSIAIVYPNANLNFTIDNSNIQNPILIDANNQVKKVTDPLFLKFYVASYKQFSFDGYYENQNAQLIDSIYNSTPVCTINVVLTNGQTQNLKLYNKAIDKHTKQVLDESTGKPFNFDTERYWAFLNNDKSLIIAQQFNIGKLLITLNDFK